MFQKVAKLFVGCLLVVSLSATAHAASNNKGIDKLKKEKPGTSVSVGSATDTATFVRIPPGQAKKAAGGSASDLNNSAREFVGKHAEAYGLRVGSNDLTYKHTEQDDLGRSHVRYTQSYGGVPVFGASLNVHFDENGQLIATSGTLVPDIELSLAPNISETDAGDTALQWVASENDMAGVSVRNSRLVIFRDGLAKGVPGDNFLAYQVEVGNGVDVREFVFVDAHSGKFLDQITGTTDALNRRAYDGAGGSFGYVLSIWPDSPFWVEGDAFPTSDAEADNMIQASKETYDVFANAFGRDSFDGNGAFMDAVFNRGYSCPNASWNGAFISFCPGITTDDVTGHEWGHAYTDYTDDLIYQWQPGALNESYSDVIGETVDLINGRDVIPGNSARTDLSCSAIQGTPLPTFDVVDGSAAGSYFVTAPANQPAKPFTVGPAPMEVTDPAGACTFLNNDLTGKIAIVDWTETSPGNSECFSGNRTIYSYFAGAEGVIFIAPEGGFIGLGSHPILGSVQVSYEDGQAIKASLPANGTFEFTLGSDNSVRWLMGEDSTAPGLSGALRDMWNPNCMGDPGHVTDPLYHCATSDNGGVHINSGIPNRLFALLVDGGNLNGYSINAIGLTKANHIEFRAKTHYQGPATDFVGHADALEQSCADLTGTNLASLEDGSPSGEIISAADCAQVTKAIAAVELRTPPTQCGFEPLLAQNPPQLCDSPTKSTRMLLDDSFDNGKSSLARWDRSYGGTTPDFTERNWELTRDLPDGRRGQAFFGIDANLGTCQPGGDETAVLHLDSPQIVIPASADPANLRAAFDHWVGTESGWDGGNIKISVNGGEWMVVDPSSFVYNPYNINDFGINFLIPAPFSSNPLAGEYGWSGSDGGSVDGSWGRSIIDLSSYAAPNDKIQLRFDMGNDGCFGTFGWYVDDVKVYECR